MKTEILVVVKRNWKFIVAVILPFILLPIAFLGESETDVKRFRCGYTIILMGIFWMLEVLPLAVTAFFPVVFFPLLGVQSTGDVVANYMKETQMMFIGGISLALSLQYCGLHKRIALRTMIMIGSSPWRLLLGILVTTTLLSCVIVVNTAVAAMMTPIVAGLMEGIDTSVTEKQKQKLRLAFMLAVGYGANLGGTATIIGSQSALIYKELIEKENVGQDGKYTDLNFFTYSAFSIPLAAINVIIVWFVLGAFHLGFKTSVSSVHENDPNANSKSSEILTQKNGVNNMDNEELGMSSLVEDQMGVTLKKKYKELGRIGFHEWAILALLSLAILLWFTRDPQVFTGWNSLFPEDIQIGDSTVGIAVVIIMFIIPQKRNFFKRDYEEKTETLLTWKYIQEHFPWNVIFIVGGGLAISDGAGVSGLSTWLGEQLMALESLPRELILLILLVTISVFTEFMSNSATISLITPILITLSRTLDIHPLYFTLPGAIACQYAFMLPTSNPPNAIVYSAGDMKIGDMVKAGVVLNFACITVLYLMNLTWGEYVIFSYSDYIYANSTVT